ncbi:hypothetical protein TNCV_3515461 [Trichonephila clavipes]|nr:hypothetical protein TNCV_3515461 [Trichonephila clavipes]
MKQNDIEDYQKPVMKLQYYIWRLHDGLMGFLCVGIRLRTYKAQVDPPKRKNLEQPPYSPNMGLCDFHMFPKLKEPLCGRRFHDFLSVGCLVVRSVAEIDNQHFTNGLQRLPDIWQNFIRFAGDNKEEI